LLVTLCSFPPSFLSLLSRFLQTLYNMAASQLSIAQRMNPTPSLKRQAEAHFLGIAQIPVDALTGNWTIGSNRPIDGTHVNDLCRLFSENGLDRRTEPNRILVECAKEDYERMVKFNQESIRNRGAQTILCTEPQLFKQWMRVNRKQVEIIAGQHRVAALAVFLRNQAIEVSGFNIEGNSWWTCEIYNSGKTTPNSGTLLTEYRHATA
jgi:hypothetical protein